MNILKRNGQEVPFNINKIKIAIQKASDEVANNIDIMAALDKDDIDYISKKVSNICYNLQYTPNVEQIQDIVIYQLKDFPVVAKAYTEYRYKKELQRKANSTDNEILSLIELQNEEVKQENSNKNSTIVSVQRDYMAGAVSKDLTFRLLLPKHIKKAHDEGIIHFHDSDYFAQHIYNCSLINLEDMLYNGTNLSGVNIDPPKSFGVGCTVASQIVSQVASSQYGGQTISLSHLAPLVDVSRRKIRKEVIEEFKENEFELDNNKIERTVQRRLLKEIENGCQTIQYQLVTLMTTNGQAPFVTVFMYLNEVEESLKDDLALIIRTMLKQRILGVKNEQGIYISPAFPKLIYVLEEDNISEDSKYWDLTVLAAQCTAKRMVPDYISEKKMLELKGEVYPCMGCRSFLTVDRFTDNNIGNISNAGNYNPNKHKYYGRFNQGVVTINLVDVACSSKRDITRFWEILEERLELCHEALQYRHNRLLGTVSDVAPILWQHGAIARLKKGEVIDKLLYNGYSTISLGYAGIYEMTMYMTGESHTSEKGKKFALEVMQKLNDKCNEWKIKENIDYSVYGTPLESTTYKFAKCLKQRFGEIPEVTNHNYITNSYHINVREEIDAFSKLSKEAEFQVLSPGGAISYVEVPNLQDNIEAVLEVMKHIYNNIVYAELNTKSDYCQECGFNGEIVIEEDNNHKLYWKCPNCGNTDENKLNVARRTCGYIGTNFWNQGRTQEIKERKLHL